MVMEGGRVKLSNASKPTVHVLQGGVHLFKLPCYRNTVESFKHCYYLCVYVCMCVLCVCVLCLYVCVLVESVQMCMRHLVFKFYFLSICEHSNLDLPSFPLCVL